MRIDQNIPAQIQVGKAAEKGTKRAEEAAGREGSGATLTLHDAVASLSGSSAEIRQERVQALKAAVDSNSYKPEPDKIADAMLSALVNWR
jgi:flagellar biosynthesis anti-sigma factor FlgM